MDSLDLMGISPRLSIGKAARLLGFCNKTLVRYGKAGRLKFEIGNQGRRYIERDLLERSPVFTLSRAAKKLGVKTRQLRRFARAFEERNPPSEEVNRRLRYRYFSLVVLRMLRKGPVNPSRIRVRYILENRVIMNGHATRSYLTRLCVLYEKANGERDGDE